MNNRTLSQASTDTMSVEASHDQSFRIERHGEVAVVIPSSKVEEMHETLIAQAAKMVVDSLKEDPPAGIVIDLSHVNFVGSVFVSFLLRCHMLAKKQGSEIVLAGASEPARELLHLLDLETLWALYGTRQEAIEALSGSD
jgi:anti-sigma B factor antagonist